MSISSIVAELAAALAPVVTDAGPKALLAQAAEMPRYVSEARLDLWEQALNGGRRIPKESAQELAVAELVELGRFNMFGEIDEDETRVYLERALASAHAIGAVIELDPRSADITDW